MAGKYEEARPLREKVLVAFFMYPKANILIAKVAFAESDLATAEQVIEKVAQQLVVADSAYYEVKQLEQLKLNLQKVSSGNRLLPILSDFGKCKFSEPDISSIREVHALRKYRALIIIDVQQLS